MPPSSSNNDFAIVCYLHILFYFECPQNPSYISGTGVTGELDVSNLASLTTLNISGTGVTGELDVSKLTSLTTLNVTDTGITGLTDLSNLTSLRSLLIYNTGLSGELDVSALPALTEIAGYGTKITGITFGAANTNLNLIRMSDTPSLTTLTGLEHLTCQTGGGVDLRINNTSVPAIEIPASSAYFKQILCQKNETLERISIGDGVTVKSLDLTNAAAVTSISFPTTAMNMTTLNLSGTTALTNLENLHNQLTTLEGLTLDGTKLENSIPQLDFSNSSTLTTLSLLNFPNTTVKLPTNGGSITSLTLNNVKTDGLDLSAMNNLETLSLLNLSGTDLTLPSSNTAITTLTLDNLAFQNIDLSGMTGLITINLRNMPKGFHVNFGSNTTTTTLNLTGSDLSEYENGQMSGSLDKLQHLVLNNTKLKSFDSSSVVGLDNINRVSLNNNAELESVNIENDGNKIKRLFADNCRKLSLLKVEDNQEIVIISANNATSLTTEGFQLEESYKKLGYIYCSSAGLTGTFKVPKMETSYNLVYMEDGSGEYSYGTQVDVNYTKIEILDVTNAGTVNTIAVRSCSKLTKIVGLENLKDLRYLAASNVPNLHYLDLPNFKNNGDRRIDISGTDLAYLNIPDGVTLNVGYNAGNLKTQSIDVEIGGYDKDKGYWADLVEAFPGIKMENISNLRDPNVNARTSGPYIDGNRVYGIQPDGYATYTYQVNVRYTMNPTIHFVDIKLVDKSEVPVGDSGVVVTLPENSVAKPGGSFTTPGDLTVNPDGTITTENGTNLTIPETGAVVTEDGKVTLPQGDVTYMVSDKTLTVPDGAVVNPDGTITWPKGDIAVNPDGSVTIGNGDTVKPDGDVQIDDEGNIFLPDGGSITAPDGTVQTVAPGTTVFPDGTTDEEETPTDPGEGDPTNPGGDPTDPGEDPTNPGGDPTDPGEDPTNPGGDPTNPGENPTNPGEQPTDPGENPTNPGEQPTDPDNGQNPSEPTPDQGNTGNGGNQNTGSTQTGTQTSTPGREGSGTGTDGKSGAEGISGQSTGNAQTGDSSQVTLWAGLLSVSAMALGFLGYRRRKHKGI